MCKCIRFYISRTRVQKIFCQRSCFQSSSVWLQSSSSISHDVIHHGFKLTIVIKKKKKKTILSLSVKEHSSRLLAGSDRKLRKLFKLSSTRSNIFYYRSDPFAPSSLSPPLKAYHHLNDPHSFVSLAPSLPTVPHQTFHAVEFYQGTPRVIIDLARRRGEDSILTCFGYKLWAGWSSRIPARKH